MESDLVLDFFWKLVKFNGENSAGGLSILFTGAAMLEVTEWRQVMLLQISTNQEGAWTVSTNEGSEYSEVALGNCHSLCMVKALNPASVGNQSLHVLLI